MPIWTPHGTLCTDCQCHVHGPYPGKVTSCFRHFNRGLFCCISKYCCISMADVLWWVVWHNVTSQVVGLTRDIMPQNYTHPCDCERGPTAGPYQFNQALYVSCYRIVSRLHWLYIYVKQWKYCSPTAFTLSLSQAKPDCGRHTASIPGIGVLAWA